MMNGPYQSYSNRNWMHILAAAALVVLIFSNYFIFNNFKEAVVKSTLDFDNSLSAYVDHVLTTEQVEKFIPILVILAHVYMYIYIYLLIQYYVFPMQGFLSNILISSLAIMLLHTIAFVFLDHNTFTFSSLKHVVPYSGLWHVLMNFSNLTNEIKSVVTNTTNITNETINVDLT